MAISRVFTVININVVSLLMPAFINSLLLFTDSYP